MWFRNLRLFRLTTPFSHSAEELHERLAQYAFRHCGSLEFASQGWVSPLGRHSTQLAHAANGCILICARREEKILPAATVRDLLEEKVLAIEEQENRRLRRKEKERIREEIVHELLPRALTRSGLTFAYVSVRDGWLVVDAPSVKKAEELASLLRRSLGSLPAVPCTTKENATTVLTQWLAGDLPADFALEQDYELREPGDEGAVLRCRRQDPTTDEVQSHLRSGKHAVKLAVEWNERLSCVLDAQLAIKRLRFSDVVLEESAQVEAEDEASRIDADFAFMTLELSRFIPRLVEVFGGEDQAAYAPAERAA